MSSSDTSSSHTFVNESPLALPDKKFLHHDNTMIDCNRDKYNELRSGRDKKKFKKGNGCYVDGAVYTQLSSEMKVLPSNYDYDLVFDTLGLKAPFTMVKVRNVNKRINEKLGNMIDGLKPELLKIKGNARQKRLSCDNDYKMFAFGSNLKSSKTSSSSVPFFTNKRIKFHSTQSYNKYRQSNLTFSQNIK